MHTPTHSTDAPFPRPPCSTSQQGSGGARTLTDTRQHATDVHPLHTRHTHMAPSACVIWDRPCEHSQHACRLGNGICRLPCTLMM